MIDAKLQSTIADAVSGSVSGVGDAQAPGVGTPPLPEADADDQAHFQAALKTPSAESAQETASALDTASLPPRTEPVSPGDAILQGVDKLRGDSQALANQTAAIGENPNQLSLNEMFSLQMKVAQVTLGTQLASQVASKVQQDLNTLLKSS